MTAPTAPTREIGYSTVGTGTATYNWWMYDGESTPELQWPQSIEIYDAMRKQDAQVQSVIRAVTLPVRRTPWRIDPAGAAPDVVQLVAQDFGLPIVGQPALEPPPRIRDRFSWPEHLRMALLMLPFGHMYFEQVYRVDEDGGRAHLRKLGERMPRTIASIEVARDGGLVSITQHSTLDSSGPQKPIPVSRLVAYIHEREGGNWLGQSILRSAYKNWLLKDRLLRVQAQSVDRNGMGIPLYTAAEGESDLSRGKALATSLRAGESAGAAVPNGATLTLLGVDGQLPNADVPIRYHDEQIARAVLAHFLNLGTQTGSWALGTTFADFFTLSLQTLAQQVADVATQHIIEDLVDVNFGEDEPAPRLVFDEIGSRQEATAQAIKLLIDAGVIRPDQVLEQFSRQQYGLPPAPPGGDERPPVDGAGSDAGSTLSPDVDGQAVLDGFGAESVAASAATDLDDEDQDDDVDDMTWCLLVAMDEIAGTPVAAKAAFNPALHPRHKDSGKFRTTINRLIDTLNRFAKSGATGNPFKPQEFSREQLRRAAKKRGISLKRNASYDDISKALIRDLTGGSNDPKTPATKPAAPADKAGTADAEALRDELDLKKVDELKKLLREAGLPVSGRKRELVDRLVNARTAGGDSKAAKPDVAPAPATKANPAKRAPKLPPGVPDDAKKLTKAITGGPDVYEVEVAPHLGGVHTRRSGTAGFFTVHYNGRDLGDVKQASDGSWQVWQNQGGIELGAKFATRDKAAQAVAVGWLPGSQRWHLPRASYDLYDADGTLIGGWDQHSGWKTSRDASGGGVNLNWQRSTKTLVVKALLAHNVRQKQLAEAREKAAVAQRERLARAEKADANIAAAQAVLYGTDPDATSPSRQLHVYGALDARDFKRMDPGEQSAMLADLAHIATTSDGKDASRARQLIGWFTPAGTPAGMVPRPPASVGIGPINGTQDRFDTPQLGLAVLPDDERGQSGDGWYTGTAGSTRWGQYGAAGVLLRHVDDDGTERFLMVQRGPGVSDPGVWSFPGGAKDQNETFLQGGARELVEEMGLPEDTLSSAIVYGTHASEAPDLMVPSAGGGEESWKYVSIAADVDTQLQIDLTGDHTWETADARWLTRDEIADLDQRGKLHHPVAGGRLQQNVMSLFPASDLAERISRGNGGQPARLAGTPARPRPVVSDYTATEEGFQDLAALVADGHHAYAGKTADSRLAAIAAAQGFDLPPTVVTSKQFDDLLATGDYIEIWRGVTPSYDYDDEDEEVLMSAAEIQEQLRSGPAYYGTGIYGNGYYFAEERAIAEGYASSEGSLVRALIPRSASVIELRDVHDDMQRAGASNPFRSGSSGLFGGGGRDDDPIDGDDGRFAAARGWDGIRIDSYSTKPIYNIVNRSMLIVDQSDHVPGFKTIAATDLRPGMTIRLSATDLVKVASVQRESAGAPGLQDILIVTTTGGSERSFPVSADIQVVE